MKHLIPELAARPPSTEEKLHAMMSLVAEAKKNTAREDYEILENLERDLADKTLGYANKHEGKKWFESVICQVSEGVTIGLTHALTHPL